MVRPLPLAIFVRVASLAALAAGICMRCIDVHEADQNETQKPE